MKTSVLVLLLLSSFKLALCDHLMLGNTDNNRMLLNHQKVEYASFPLVKRVKQYFYTDLKQRVIKGIIAYDNFNSKATIQVTAGGVGQTYVNFRMKSERGEGLSYDIGIYGEGPYSPIQYRYGGFEDER